MTATIAIRAGLAALALAAAYHDHRRGGGARAGRRLVTLLALAALVVMGAAFADHVGFPLHLDVMEPVVLEHVARVAAGAPAYPAPEPGFVPLAYNPLYYVVAAPCTRLLGLDLSTLRAVSIAAVLGSLLVVAAAVRRRTGSGWWALVAAGLFAASYRVMDCYLDTAHSDACFLFAALLGTWLLDRWRTRSGTLVAVAVLVSAFWFKQHGALFALGGVAWVTWRDGVRRAWPAWLLAALLGPVLYLAGGAALFGPAFHEMTWTVPRQWSEPRLASVARMVALVGAHYPVLAIATAAAAAAVWRRRPPALDAWHVGLVAATLSALLATLDPWNANNVFVPLETWCVVAGTVAIAGWAARAADAPRRPVSARQALAVALSFAALAYDPRSVLVATGAPAAFEDLQRTLRALPGTVYAPDLGGALGDVRFAPAAHWVALDDLVRGPGRSVKDQPRIRRLVAPALSPAGPAWMLTNLPLRDYPVLAFLRAAYVLDIDFGDRFAALHPTPRRYDHGHPRYLYRYAPPEARAASARETLR